MKRRIVLFIVCISWLGCIEDLGNLSVNPENVHWSPIECESGQTSFFADFFVYDSSSLAPIDSVKFTISGTSDRVHYSNSAGYVRLSRTACADWDSLYPTVWIWKTSYTYRSSGSMFVFTQDETNPPKYDIYMFPK